MNKEVAQFFSPYFSYFCSGSSSQGCKIVFQQNCLHMKTSPRGAGAAGVDKKLGEAEGGGDGRGVGGKKGRGV